MYRESTPVSDIKLAHCTEKREIDAHYRKPGMQRGVRVVELAWNPIGKRDKFMVLKWCIGVLLASCGNDKTVKVRID